MEPRLKSSKKWSPFPQELSESAALVLKERFSDEFDLKGAEFVVEGRIYTHEIIGRYGLRSKNQLKQQNFEVSFEYDSEKEKALDRIHQSMDVVEHLWSELLEDDLEDSELLKTWQTMPYEKKMYFFRFSIVNSKLEEEADKLLAEYEKKLVYESSDYDEEDVVVEDDDTLSGFDSLEDSDEMIDREVEEDSSYEDQEPREEDSTDKKTIH